MIDWSTYIASIITSLVVALVTFVLGVKSGKNQTDRQKLQELYKSLLVHFQDLKERLDSCPRRWEQYEEHSAGWNITYLPPVRKMERDGNSIYIRPRLFKETLELERDTLKFGFDVEQFYTEVFDAIESDKSLFNVPTETSMGERTRKIKANDGKLYNTGRIMRLYECLSPGFSVSVRSALRSNGYLELHDDSNPYQFELIINPGAYKDSETLARKLGALVAECQSHDRLIAERDALKSRIDTLLKKLARRAKEPVPFWETFSGAFIDVFRP